MAPGGRTPRPQRGGRNPSPRAPSPEAERGRKTILLPLSASERGGRGGGVLYGVRLRSSALLLDQRADALAQQGDVERFLEGLVETEVAQALRRRLILAGQGDDERLLERRNAPQVLGDLQRLAPSHRQVDDDGIGVKTVGGLAGLEAAVGHLVLVILVVGQQFLEPVDEQLLGADDQNLVPALLFECPQGHVVLFEEADELVAGDAPILAAGNTVAAQLAGIEPLAHRPRRDLTDLRYLAGGKHFLHGRHSTT